EGRRQETRREEGGGEKGHRAQAGGPQDGPKGCQEALTPTAVPIVVPRPPAAQAAGGSGPGFPHKINYRIISTEAGMAIKINKKIKGYSVQKPEDKAKEAAPAAAPVVRAEPESNIIQMHEKVERPEVLVGATYKIKSPLVEHAMYVTINDIVLNQGTEHELRRPFEVFINSKNMDHFQWIVALTRIMSAVFRKGGDVTFLVDEMKAVFDPRGGYFKAGGVYMPSIVA